MNKQDVIEEVASNYWNIRDDLKGKTLDELKQIAHDATLPFAVCAINITGDLNLGMMLRTACLLGAERFIIYGRHGYDRRSTVGAHNYIDVVKAGSIDRGGSMEIDYTDFFPTMDKFNYDPIFFETGGTSLYDIDFRPYTDYVNAKVPCLVFGNEGIGIEPSLLVGQKVVSIAQRGVLRSLNVCAAASIAMEFFSHKMSKMYDRPPGIPDDHWEYMHGRGPCPKDWGKIR
jgi:tRNA G18 (ribose-2'-O)-methylase SpoU